MFQWSQYLNILLDWKTEHILAYSISLSNYSQLICFWQKYEISWKNIKRKKTDQNNWVPEKWIYTLIVETFTKINLVLHTNLYWTVSSHRNYSFNKTNKTKNKLISWKKISDLFIVIILQHPNNKLFDLPKLSSVVGWVLELW